MSDYASGPGRSVSRTAIAVGVIGIAAALAPPMAGPAIAAPATKCTAKLDKIVLEPGLALTKSAPGKFRNLGKGTVECDGPVLGKKPSGPGVWVTNKGTFVGNCANGGKGKLTQTFKIPTEQGEVTLVNKGPYTYGALKGGAIGGEVDGNTVEGPFSVTPKKGNCVTEPMSQLAVVFTMTLKG